MINVISLQHIHVVLEDILSVNMKKWYILALTVNMLQPQPDIFRNKHEEVRFDCGKCEYSAFTASNLRNHMKTKHKEVKYPCDKCQYSVSSAGLLKRHIKIILEGIRYPFDQCELAATSASAFKTTCWEYTRRSEVPLW